MNPRRWLARGLMALALVVTYPGVASAQEEQSNQGMVYGYVVAFFITGFCIYATLKSARRS
jgi:hypothetical protein